MAVVPFPPQEEKVWQCAQCGCQTFFLHVNGQTECACCHHFGDGHDGQWSAWDGSVIKEGLRAHSTTKMPSHASEALGFVLKRATVDNAVAVIVMAKDGRTTVWGDNFATRSARGWLRRRLEDARRLLLEIPLRNEDSSE